jgi:hypothetical protein
MYNIPENEKQMEDEWKRYSAFSGHCWLEDEEGNVYDYWTANEFKGINRNIRVDKTLKQYIHKTFGYEYIEFPKSIQTKMFVLMLNKLQREEQILNLLH